MRAQSSCPMFSKGSGVLHSFASLGVVWSSIWEKRRNKGSTSTRTGPHIRTLLFDFETCGKEPLTPSAWSCLYSSIFFSWRTGYFHKTRYQCYVVQWIAVGPIHFPFDFNARYSYNWSCGHLHNQDRVHWSRSQSWNCVVRGSTKRLLPQCKK